MFPRLRVLVASLLAAMLAAALGTGVAPASDRLLIIRGRITDAENWPIGDVKVAATGSRRANATTDVSGQYELEIPLGTPAELARKPLVLRVTARLRGWRTSLPEGAEALGLELRVTSGEDEAARCEIRSNHARVTSAIARAVAGSEGRGTAQVNFLAERGTPSEDVAELDLSSTERVTLAGVEAPRAEARTGSPRAQAAREREPVEREAGKPEAKKSSRASTKSTTARSGRGGQKSMEAPPAKWIRPREDTGTPSSRGQKAAKPVEEATEKPAEKRGEKPVRKAADKPAKQTAEKPAAATTTEKQAAKTPAPATPLPHERRPASSMSLPLSAEERAEAGAAAKLERENRRALAEARKREREAVEAEARRQREETRAREKLEKIARADAEAREREEAKRRSEARAAEEELREGRGMHDTRWDALRREVHLIAGASDTATAPPVTVLEDIAGAPPKAGSRGRPPSRRAMMAFRDTVPVAPVRHAPAPEPETPPPPPRAAATRVAPSTPPRSAPGTSGPSRVQPPTNPAQGGDRVAAPVRPPARSEPSRTQDPAPRPTTETVTRGGDGDGDATLPVAAPPRGTTARTPRIVPTPDGEGRARARPILIRAPGPGSAPEDTAAGTCMCRVEGSVEVQSERPLPARARVAVSLVWYPALADTVELFMGSPRAFRLPPAPCGPQRLKVTSLGSARFDVISRETMAGFRCTAGSLHQHRLVLVPR